MRLTFAASIGALERGNLAAIDTGTGTPTSWNPRVNFIVEALALSGNTVYTGGERNG